MLVSNNYYALDKTVHVAEMVISVKTKNQGKLPLVSKVTVRKGVILIGNNTTCSISKLTEESSLNEANLNELPNEASHEVSLLTA